ncbi:MAG: hypothetical protein FD180_1341 [Planctomycetota bacterium]|nr:MAG: hypothetical protein FD180_1341 [Planctomycetota bacterium]
MRIVLVMAALLAPLAAWGQSEELQKIREELEISKKRLDELEKKEAEKTPDKTVTRSNEAWGVSLGGGATARLIDVSLDILALGGTSTARDAELDLLNPGHHDPAGRGFTLQNVELTLSGAVDPYFNAEAHVTYVVSDSGESEIELEEAFFTTTSLPGGFQIRGGHSFLEFGRQNRQHPHAWHFVDQPVAFSRFFGADGLRSTGVNASWLAPTPFYLEAVAGVYNAFGETMFSFNQDGAEVVPSFQERRDLRTWRDLAYLGRLTSTLDIGESIATSFGVSYIHGPNATGRHADTDIYGADFYVRWKPVRNERGWPFVQFQAEFLMRRYERGAFDDGAGSEFGHEWFQDWGYYAQAVVGFTPGWTAGLRFDRADGELNTLNPLHDSRYRISPALTWYPTEFSKIRLQYNYDHARHIQTGHGYDEHSIWLQVEVLIGKHGAHKF